jgi:AraC-like DNA-binding protein
MDVHQATGAARISGRLVRLPSRPLLDTDDVDEAESVVEGLLSENRIRVEGPAREFHARILESSFGDLRLAHFTYGAAFTVEAQPLGCYLVNLTLRGQANARHGTASVAARIDEATVFSPFSPTSLGWTKDTEVLCLMVPQPAIEQHFRKLTGVAAGRIEFGTQVPTSSAHLLRSVIGSALSTSAGDVAGLSEALSWQLRETVLTAMLLELPHNKGEVVLKGHKSPANQLCDTAIGLMRRQLHMPPSIPALAARLGVSERSLQVAFREHLGTTPGAKLKQLRLEAVHEALVRSNPQHHTVHQVASDVGGFYHHGRFATEYLAMFGRRPADTLRR